MYLEEGDLDAAQKLARDTAHDNGLSFPDKLPELGREPSPEKPETGWYHFDAVLLATEPQGIDDGYGVGVVDVYTHRETGDFAARYLPMGEYATFDAALERQHTLLHHRLVEGRDSALETSGFNHSPALYKRFAQQEADNALTDLLEKYDGHYPPDYDGDYEPEWEPLASKEWEAYRDHVQVISEIVPGTDSILKSLPSATPGFASNTLAAASDQPEAPYHLPEELQPQAFSPFWHLDIVPAHDTEGQSLGYSAVCVVDYGDLAEVVAPDSTECAMWLEVAQFQTEDRANQFKDDFMSLVKSDELDHITGPALAGFIADDLGTESQWQTMNQATLDKLNAGKWTISHAEDAWQPRLNGDLPNHTIEVASIDIAL
jgi:hypothetical protein